MKMLSDHIKSTLSALKAFSLSDDEKELGGIAVENEEPINIDEYTPAKKISVADPIVTA